MDTSKPTDDKELEIIKNDERVQRVLRENGTTVKKEHAPPLKNQLPGWE